MTTNDSTQLPLSLPIQEFIDSLFAGVKERGIHCFIPRSYDALPEKCGFDIDMFSSENDRENLVTLIAEITEVHQLRLFKKRVAGKTEKLFIVAPGLDKNLRRWLYIDLQTSIDLGKEFKFNAEEVSVTHNAKDVPIPTPEWEFLLLFLDSLKKSKLGLNNSTLNSLLKEVDDDSFVFTRLEASRAEIEKLIIGSSDKAIAFITKHRIPQQIEKRPKVTISLKERISKFIFNRLLFIHIHHPLFYTIQGADGVGKTTAGNLVAETFAQYPLPFSFFHHTSEWKKNINTNMESTSSGNGTPASNATTVASTLSWKRRILKAIWKIVPPFLKHLWGVVGSELSYAKQVNRLIAERFFGGKIILADRYVYDRTIKMRFAKKTQTQRFICSLFSRYMLRPPVLAFALTDLPENVYQRKQELTIEEIAQYQKNMFTVCNELNIPLINISITDKTPDEVALEIVSGLLDSLDVDLFGLIGLWEQNERQQK